MKPPYITSVPIILAGSNDGYLSVYNATTGEALLSMEPWVRSKAVGKESHPMKYIDHILCLNQEFKECTNLNENNSSEANSNTLCVLENGGKISSNGNQEKTARCNYIVLASGKTIALFPLVLPSQTDIRDMNIRRSELAVTSVKLTNIPLYLNILRNPHKNSFLNNAILAVFPEGNIALFDIPSLDFIWSSPIHTSLSYGDSGSIQSVITSREGHLLFLTKHGEVIHFHIFVPQPSSTSTGEVS